MQNCTGLIKQNHTCHFMWDFARISEISSKRLVLLNETCFALKRHETSLIEENHRSCWAKTSLFKNQIHWQVSLSSKSHEISLLSHGTLPWPIRVSKIPKSWEKTRDFILKYFRSKSKSVYNRYAKNIQIQYCHAHSIHKEWEVKQQANVITTTWSRNADIAKRVFIWSATLFCIGRNPQFSLGGGEFEIRRWVQARTRLLNNQSISSVTGPSRVSTFIILSKSTYVSEFVAPLDSPHCHGVSDIIL